MPAHRAQKSASPAAAAPVFAALGDATRLGILLRLRQDGPLSTTRLTANIRISRQAVTKHLETLEKARLLSSRHEGRERVWTLEAGRLKDAQAYIEQISGQWDQAIGRLRAFVERP